MLYAWNEHNIIYPKKKLKKKKKNAGTASVQSIGDELCFLHVDCRNILMFKKKKKKKKNYYLSPQPEILKHPSWKLSYMGSLNHW